MKTKLRQLAIKLGIIKMPLAYWIKNYKLKIEPKEIIVKSKAKWI